MSLKRAYEILQVVKKSIKTWKPNPFRKHVNVMIISVIKNNCYSKKYSVFTWNDEIIKTRHIVSLGVYATTESGVFSIETMNITNGSFCQ